MEVLKMKDEMTKDFDFIAKYARKMRDEKEKIFSNKIVWKDNILYGTNGQTFLYTETDEKNPEGVSVWIIKGKKYEKCHADSETVKEFTERKLERRILDTFVKYDGSFYVDWQKDVPLPLKLCSAPSKRCKDRISFDLVNDTINMVFNSGEVDEVKAEYGDFIKDKTEESAGFNFPLWIFMNFLKNAKDRIKVQYCNSSLTTYAKMTEGKWNLVFITYQN